MGISQRLCEVRDQEFGGKQLAMAETWGIPQPTLSRWLRRTNIPDASWYDFLAGKLGLSIGEVHELCKAERTRREPAPSALKVAV